MIIFGWNSLLIKSYLLQEFGFFQPDLSQVRVEHRQRYFHLMFIPFFPIGRFWTIRLNGKMYEPSGDILAVLKSTKTNNKNALWAWSGVFAVLLGFFFVSMSEKMTEARYKKQSEERSKNMAAMLQTNPDIKPVLNKIDQVDRLTDSMLNLPIPKQKEMDTSESAIISLLLSTAGTQKDSISGISEENNLVIASFTEPYSGNQYISQEDYKMLTAKQYDGYYMDTSTLVSMLRRIKGYRYLTLIRENNRVDGMVVDDKSFSSGYILCEVHIFDIEKGKIITKFKSLGTNGTSLSTIVYGEHSSGREQLSRELDYDLARNSVKHIMEYVYGKEDELGSFGKYYTRSNGRRDGY